jgi:hypothetical protein
MSQALGVATGEVSGETIVNGKGLLPLRVKELMLPRAFQLGLEMTKLETSQSLPLGWSRPN